MRKEQIIPKWLFYTCVILIAGGGTQLITGNLKWGITNPKNTLIILVVLSSVILMFDIIYGLIRKRKKK